ncbi:MAG TPA: hypothetical protein VEA44_16145 [Caulobacter sp.]|nr:hypothetical protein [Caulobacter sp.]
MQLPLIQGVQPSAGRRRGRPPGSKGKRSGDLRAYIEAVYGGLTPGQQMAQVGLVTARELREAKAAAKASGLSPLLQAMVTKAQLLALQLGCEPKEAWLLMMKEREGLLPYVHQRQAPAEGPKRPAGEGQPTLIVADVEVSDVAHTDWEEPEVFQGPSPTPLLEVAQAKSHDEAESLMPQGVEGDEAAD